LTSRLDPESLGEITGGIVVFFIFPYFMGSIFWYTLGRKEHGGTTTFNVILTLLVISQFNLFIKESNTKNKANADIKGALGQYKSELLNEPDSSNLAFDKFFGKIENSVDELIENSEGDEKKMYIVLQKFMKNAESVNGKWLETHAEISKSDFFDMGLLKDKKICENQIKAMDNFLIATQEYKIFFFNRVTLVDKMFKQEGLDSETTSVFLDAMKKKQATQMPVFSSYINNNIEYAQKVKVLIKNLKDYKWTYSEESGVIFNNNPNELDFYNLLEEVSILEDEINYLSEQMIEVL
jgi:ABC-type Na+ transport system ATPase subunit NatA